MARWIDLPKVQIGRYGALPDVVYISGVSNAVAQSMEWLKSVLGTVDVLAESCIGDERSVQIRLTPNRIGL